MEKIKAIKISSINYSHRGNYQNPKLPYIKFGGDWLFKLGFEIGEVLEIKLEENRIILQKADKKEVEKHNLKCLIKKQLLIMEELEQKYNTL